MAGVRDTIRRGSLASSTVVPSSSVRVTGKAATGVVVWVGLGLVAGAVEGLGGEVFALGTVAAAEQAPRPTRARARSRATRRRRSGVGIGSSGRWAGGGHRSAPPLASDRVKRGVRDWRGARSAYLSLEGSSTHRGIGDRTSAQGRFTVAGLCRNLTGFAITRR